MVSHHQLGNDADPCAPAADASVDPARRRLLIAGGVFAGAWTAPSILKVSSASAATSGPGGTTTTTDGTTSSTVDDSTTTTADDTTTTTIDDTSTTQARETTTTTTITVDEDEVTSTTRPDTTTSIRIKEDGETSGGGGTPPSNTPRTGPLGGGPLAETGAEVFRLVATGGGLVAAGNAINQSVKVWKARNAAEDDLDADDDILDLTD